MHRRNALLHLSLLVPLFLASAAAAQGPGPGIQPVAITSLPFTISTPGTYYLAASLTGITNQDGIRINTSNVNLNLNGHRLAGVSGSRNGIVLNSGATTAVTIQNGTISNWGLNGISASVTKLVLVEGVNVSDCLGAGLSLGSGQVLRCSSRSNGGKGISVGAGSVLEGCVVTANGDSGISTGANSRVTACTSIENAGLGIQTSSECLVLDSLAHSNKLTGIDASSNSLVSGCTAVRNGEHGIAVFNSSRVTGCSANLNGSSTSPGSVGILATGNSNWIERNYTAFNGIGYRAVLALNFYSGNTSMGEPAFSLPSGSIVGPIMTSATLATATNPTANFDL